MGLQVSEQELNAVEAKLNQQHGLKAAIAAALWSVPVLVLWYWIFQLNDSFAPLMLAISGALIGMAVRFHGRGYTSSFGAVAFITHLAVVIAAFLFGMSLGEGQTILAVMLAGFYAAGAWAAVYIGRQTIPFTQHRAFFLLTEQRQHASYQRLKNRWFVMLPVTMILTSVTLSISLVTLAGFDLFSASVSHYEEEKKQRSNLEQKAIDVTSENLQTLSDDEAMRYAYGFYKGYLPGKRGYSRSKYPQSAYKAKRILTFLAQERDLPRAQFVLGRLTYAENGIVHIQQAADNGDSYAKIHMATEFACYGNPERATELLKLLAKTTPDTSAKKEIESILRAGYDDVCAEFSQPDFPLIYLRD